MHKSGLFEHDFLRSIQVTVKYTFRMFWVFTGRFSKTPINLFISRKPSFSDITKVKLYYTLFMMLAVKKTYELALKNLDAWRLIHINPQEIVNNSTRLLEYEKNI